MTQLKNPVLMATIGAAQGLRGEVRVKSFTDDPAALGDYGNLHSEDGRVFEVLEIREAKNVVVVRFRGINDRPLPKRSTVSNSSSSATISPTTISTRTNSSTQTSRVWKRSTAPARAMVR